MFINLVLTQQDGKISTVGKSTNLLQAVIVLEASLKFATYVTTFIQKLRLTFVREDSQTAVLGHRSDEANRNKNLRKKRQDGVAVNLLFMGLTLSLR